MDDQQDDDPIVTFLRTFGGAATLLAQHVDDGSGHCHSCVARQQGACDTWPCRIHHYAPCAATPP